jgi:alpha-glucosidase (family GH31 glycosyl hydrolase)
MPLYVRAGAIIPFDPVRQYLTQPVDGPTTIRVYTGANGQFRWYEDDGASQEYLTGKFAWSRLSWDDASKRLTIERDASAGNLELLPRMLKVQIFPAGKAAEITYDGRRADVSF